MGKLKHFLQDEQGAVTVDWVVLTAAVVLLAVIVAPPIKTAVSDMAVYIGETINEYGEYLE